jgi:integrase
LTDNPGVGEKPARETARDRVLSDDEIKTLWARLVAAEQVSTRGNLSEVKEESGANLFAPAVDQQDMTSLILPPEVALWLRLRLLTAQRGESVVKMKWADVDFARRVWVIPAADMKKGRTHVVPLAPLVVKLLKARRDVVSEGSTFVLEGGRGRNKRLGVTKALALDNFQPKDLRRTAATGMARAGVPRFIIARVLGHADRSVTGVYDWFEYLNEKRAALETWARVVSAIIDGKSSSKVVPFARAR